MFADAGWGVAHTADDVTHLVLLIRLICAAVSDGFNELLELRAIKRVTSRRSRSQTSQRSNTSVVLTRIGKQLARIPVDVRLARMIIEASRSTPRYTCRYSDYCGLLSVQDPRERPEEQREEADRIHKRFADASSDFLTALNLWMFFYNPEHKLSSSSMRKLCRSEFVHFRRMRQWHDLCEQLSSVCKEMKWTVGTVHPPRQTK